MKRKDKEKKREKAKNNKVVYILIIVVALFFGSIIMMSKSDLNDGELNDIEIENQRLLAEQGENTNESLDGTTLGYILEEQIVDIIVPFFIISMGLVVGLQILRSFRRIDF